MSTLSGFSLLAFTGLVLAASSAVALERDDDGWTVLTPSADTRKVYVSSSQGDDGNDGLTEGTAVKTLAMAKTLLRTGSADWMLLKRGDSWKEQTSLAIAPGGRSEAERIVYTCYGEDGPRPRLLSGVTFGVIKGRSNYALVSLDFYADERDPDSPTFKGPAAPGVRVRVVGPSKNLLVEDCAVRFGGISFQNTKRGEEAKEDRPLRPEERERIEVRRCMLWDNYNGQGRGPHSDRSSGMFTHSVADLLVEECFIDHGGWHDRVGGGRSIYSHNLYLSSGTRENIVRGNIIARGASHGLQARSGGLVEGNLFVRNAMAMLTGGNPANGESPFARVLRNVILESDDIAPHRWSKSGKQVRGHGIELHCRPNTLCEGNIVLDKIGGHGGAYAIYGVRSTGFDPEDLDKPCIVRGNVVANWKGTNGKSINIPDELKDSYLVEKNVVDGIEQETGRPVAFADPERRLGTYLKTLGETGGTIEFLAKARAAWLAAPKAFPVEYRARTVNDYIREGFKVEARE